MKRLRTVRKFNGKKFGLLSVRETRTKATKLGLREYGKTRVVKVGEGYATYFRSHYADVKQLE